MKVQFKPADRDTLWSDAFALARDNRPPGLDSNAITVYATGAADYALQTYIAEQKSGVPANFTEINTSGH